MSDYVTRIRTNQGEKQIDYNALANLPDLDLKQDAATAITKSNILTYLGDKSVANATNADKLGGKAASEYALASDYLKRNKDTRPLILTSGVHYGTEDQMNALNAVAGQIFLKKV